MSTEKKLDIYESKNGFEVGDIHDNHATPEITFETLEECAAWKLGRESLANSHAALVAALSEVLAHVEDESAKRVGNQCTLCKTYRDKIRAALALAEGKDAK